MVFPGRNLPLPCRPFPFHPSAQVLPKCIPDCHLVRTAIPCLSSYDSLGVFHSRGKSALSLFCKYGFRKQLQNRYGHYPILHILLSPHIHARQATLHAAHDSVHRLAGSYLIRTRSGFHRRSSPLRRTIFRSPRKPGRILHAIGVRPESLTPSIHPKLGVKSRHQGLHRYALYRIFRPYFEEAVLTRILRRRLV